MNDAHWQGVAKVVATVLSVVALAVTIWIEVHDAIDDMRTEYLVAFAEHSRALGDFRAELGQLGNRVSAAEVHVDTHERSAGEWKERIVRNEHLLHALESLVYKLRTSPLERPDPFTGADGRALAERVRELEQRGGHDGG